MVVEDEGNGNADDDFKEEEDCVNALSLVVETIMESIFVMATNDLVITIQRAISNTK